MIKDTESKDDLIKKAKELIEIDKDSQGDYQTLINKMFKENIFKKYLQYIFKNLENNYFLTTLIGISNDKNSKLDKNEKSDKNDTSNKNIFKELKSKFLKKIKVNNNVKYEPKFYLIIKYQDFIIFIKIYLII